jgi:hypothetical protein
LKQTRNLTLILVLLLVVAFTYLMTDYARQQKRQAALINQIENITRSLSILPTPATDLEQRLADTTAANTKALQTLSDNTLNSTAIIDSLLILADSCNLKLTPLTTGSWINKKVAESVYKVLPIDLQVRGTLSGLIDFVKMIDNPQKFPNLVLAGIRVDNAREAPNTVGNRSDIITANLSLTVVVRLPSSP